MALHGKRSGFSPKGYLSDDTIAAIATAVGGAVAIIRVSGAKAFQITANLGVTPAEPRKLIRVPLRLNNELLDDAMAAHFPHPDSFTGEDVVELHIHGGAFTANRIMENLVTLGARQALPGEFSFRAVRNGKTTLPQAQAVADLIAATNEGAVTLALEKMSGAQNHLLSNLAEGLRKLAVLGEAGIDFADQDLEEVSLPRLKSSLSSLLNSLEKLRGSYDRGFRLQDGVRVAFVGLPNAGKSSFFNALLGEDRSIVSEIAGTTRDTVREQLSLRSRSGRATVTLRLEDTAGLRHTGDAVEKMGIARTRQSAETADLILFLLDPLLDINAAHEQFLALGAPVSKTLGIITKADLIPDPRRSEVSKDLARFGVSSWTETSSLTGQGIAEAVDQIIDFSENCIAREKGEILLTRLDQVKAVSETIVHLERARQAQEIDLFAADLRHALACLGPLAGDTAPDDILGQIFSDFCIGK